MSAIGIGDMAQHFTFARNTTAIKSELASLTNSLSTGKVGDLTETLGGQTSRYAHISYDLTQITAFRETAEEIALSLAAKQSAIAQFDAIRATASDSLLKVGDFSDGNQVDQAAAQSDAAFTDLVGVLNSRFADRSLFSGTQVASATTLSADEMLNAIAATLAPGADVADIAQAVDNYFADPLGGFATTGYLGDDTPGPAQRISETRKIPQTPTALDPGFTATLAAAATAAMADHLGTLDLDARRDLLQHAGTAMHIAADNLTAIRAEIGASEEIVETTLSELSGRRTTLGVAQNGLDQADPFETATALQSIQLQLETHFSAMSRLSQLSLLRFL